MDTSATLLDAMRYFSNLDRCEDYLWRLRWPGGKPRCPKCESTNIGEIKTLRLLRCKDCRRKIYIKRGTIFEDSALGLDKWFVAIWSIANCNNSISSCELARALGVQQKTAWYMLHRIRTAMEIDEGRGLVGKAAMHGVPQRGGSDQGFAAFHELAKRIIVVTKEQVDARIAQKRGKPAGNPPKK